MTKYTHYYTLKRQKSYLIFPMIILYYAFISEKWPYMQNKISIFSISINSEIH